MTVTLELEEADVERLLVVLEANIEAVGKTDALRWTDDSASRIDQIKNTIETQTSN